jgi:hypothetical protein
MSTTARSPAGATRTRAGSGSPRCPLGPTVTQGTSPQPATARYRANGRVAAIFVTDDAGRIWYGGSGQLITTRCF